MKQEQTMTEPDETRERLDPNHLRKVLHEQRALERVDAEVTGCQTDR